MANYMFMLINGEIRVAHYSIVGQALNRNIQKLQWLGDIMCEREGRKVGDGCEKCDSVCINV